MPQLHIYLVAFLFLSSLLPSITSKETPDMVVVLTRHGAREGLTDHWGSKWEHTSYIMNAGIEQHYTVGALLAKKYSELLKDVKISEVLLDYSLRSRTQMSVAAELQGLFHNRPHKHERKDFVVPFENKEMLNEVIDDLMNEPGRVPNRMQLMVKEGGILPENNILAFGPWNCQELMIGQRRRLHDQNTLRMYASFSETVRELRKLGYQVTQEEHLRDLGDDMQSRYYNNEPPLRGIPYHGKIYNDTVFYFVWWSMYSLVGSEMERSVRVFPLYSRLIEWFSAKTVGKNHLKLALLGGHETTIFPLLQLHGITNHSCYHENYMAETAGKPRPFPDCTNPNFGSQVIYEFYKNSGRPFIRMIYNGKPFRICKGSQGIDCPLEQFKKELPSFTSNLDHQQHKRICRTGPIKSAPANQRNEVIETKVVEVEIVRSETPMLFYILPALTCLLGYLVGLPDSSPLKKKFWAKQVGSLEAGSSRKIDYKSSDEHNETIVIQDAE